MSEPEVLEVSIHIDAEPSIVFPYFTDASRYVEWMGTRATIDAVPGGEYRVFMRDGVEAIGRFVEIDPPHRVEFTWGWTHDTGVAPGSTRVVVTLEEESGGTRVTLRHHGLPDEARRMHHGEGWDLYMRRLCIVAEGGIPGPDPNATTR